ncbi:MAG: hypothetical protein ACK559_13820, partial [bacterium]
MAAPVGVRLRERRTRRGRRAPEHRSESAAREADPPMAQPEFLGGSEGDRPLTRKVHGTCRAV